jgi:hypothetical protein
MATELVETPHAASFILSESNGNRSRENGTIDDGGVHSAGEVLGGTPDALVPYTSGAAAGILYAACDASDGPVEVAFITRDAEVIGAQLVWGMSDPTAGISALATRGVIVR